MQSIITESLTLVTLLLRAVERVAIQELFARDPWFVDSFLQTKPS